MNSNSNTTRNIVLGILGVFLLWQIIGGISLSMQQESIKGGVGQIWNQIQTGNEKLEAIESQLIAAYADRQDLVAKIVEGRQNMNKAVESGDLNAATSAAESLRTTLTVMVENYPATDLSGLQVGVLDETAGIFNRIGYQRDEQIKRQVGFNQSRILFFPIGLVFARQNVLGEDFNPMSEGPKSSFDK